GARRRALQLSGPALLGVQRRLGRRARPPRAGRGRRARTRGHGVAGHGDDGGLCPRPRGGGRLVSGRLPVDGFVHPDFIPVAQTLRCLLGQYAGGAAVCVYQHGAWVVDVGGGHRGPFGSPWLHGTMSPSFSTTKGVASTVLHVLADRGLVDYDRCVAEYWPEFAQAGKERITVRHVLAHQSGLHHIRRMVGRAERMPDWEYMNHAIERTAPAYEPGTRTGYHGLTYGYLVGEIVQRVMGRRFAGGAAELSPEPLGLDGMSIAPPPAHLPRVAKLIWPDAGLSPWGGLARLHWNGHEAPELLAWPAWVVQRVADLFGVRLDLT